MDWDAHAKPEILVLTAATPWIAQRLGERFVVHVVPEVGDRRAFISGVAGGVRGVVSMSTTPGSSTPCGHAATWSASSTTGSTSGR